MFYFRNVQNELILHKNDKKKLEKSRRNLIYYTLNIANIVVTSFFNIDDNVLIASFKADVIMLDEISRVIEFNI